jgi:hypothetical protein
VTIQRLVNNFVAMVLLYKQAWMLDQSEGNDVEALQIHYKAARLEITPYVLACS